MTKKCDMEDPLILFIRDRFNRMEESMTEGFKEVKTSMNEGFGLHNDRLTSLEAEKHERKGAMTAWGVVCTTVAAVVGWFTGGASH